MVVNTLVNTFVNHILSVEVHVGMRKSCFWRGRLLKVSTCFGVCKRPKPKM
jgi:hypothetical protein